MELTSATGDTAQASFCHIFPRASRSRRATTRVTASQPPARKVVDGWPSVLPAIDTARAEACNTAMKRVTAFAVLLVVLAAPAWAGWDEGVAAHKRGDYVTALREFRVLAGQGNAIAQVAVGLMYHNGQGVPQDYAEAVKWYRKAANQGYAPAQYNLGVMYGKGQGVPQDYAEAVRWYRRAADQGLAWYRRAAEQGHADGQYNLALRYHKGKGVPQDYAEAVKWYRRAAKQGNAAAQYSLALMYDKGQGVPQDYVEAHMWFNLAAAGSPPGEVRDMAATNRDMVAKLMTPAQIAEAQRPSQGTDRAPFDPGCAAGFMVRLRHVMEPSCSVSGSSCHELSDKGRENGR